jgi:hypothetical protein
MPKKVLQYWPLYYKHITIVNDASRVVRMMIESDTRKLWRHLQSDVSRGVIYAPREHL